VACAACRKAHVSCDDQRPCSRCVRKGIAHLCVDPLKPRCRICPLHIQPMIPNDPCACLPDLVPILQVQRKETQNVALIPTACGFEPIPKKHSDILMKQEFDCSELLNLSETEMDSICQKCPFNSLDELLFDFEGDEEEKNIPQRVHHLLKARRAAGFTAPFLPSTAYQQLVYYLEHKMGSIQRQRILQTLSLLNIPNKMDDFEYYVASLERFLYGSSIPSAIWRMTGHVWKKNVAFDTLMKTDTSFIFDVLSEDSLVQIFEWAASSQSNDKGFLGQCRLKSQKPISLSLTFIRNQSGLILGVHGQFFCNY
jgi:hypothetical protein